jgi:hypothetical protein
LVESELDALLVHQEVSGSFAAVALGSAANRPHSATEKLLRDAPIILVSLDFDLPDSKGRRAGGAASRWWLEQFPQSKRWVTAAGKDPCEMHIKGVSVRLWIQAGLAEGVREDAPQVPESAWQETESSVPAETAAVAACETEPPTAATKPRRCLVCPYWRKIPRGCWWIGRCSISGTKVDFKSFCTASATMDRRGLA